MTDPSNAEQQPKCGAMASRVDFGSSAAPCALSEGHGGQHVSADGRVRWGWQHRPAAQAVTDPAGGRLRAERAQADAPDRDLSGWSAAENAEFEELYGVQAAMRLRASNNRVWEIVHELRSKAADAGLDPYQDPMAQRLSAALVHPEPEDPSDA